MKKNIAEVSKWLKRREIRSGNKANLKINIFLAKPVSLYHLQAKLHSRLIFEAIAEIY